MSRGLPSNAEAVLDSDTIAFEWLCSLEFDSETLRLWTGTGLLSWGGNDYQGNGFLINVSGYGEEAKAISGQSVSFILSGVPAELLAFALNQSKSKHVGKLFLALFDDADTLLHVEQMFSGKLDTVSINENPNSSEIVLTYEDELSKLREPRERRYSPEEQKARFFGDRGFEYIPSVAQQRLYWGRPDTTRGRGI